jgi:hypothetical protein
MTNHQERSPELRPGAPSRGEMREKDRPSWRLLCVIARYVAGELPPDAGPGDIIDALKWRIAGLGLDYPEPHELAAVADVMLHLRTKAAR